MGGDDAAGDADEATFGVEDRAAAVSFGEGDGGADDNRGGMVGVEGGHLAGGGAAIGSGPVAGGEEDVFVAWWFVAEFKADRSMDGKLDEGDVAFGEALDDAQGAAGDVADGDGGAGFEVGAVSDELVGEGHASRGLAVSGGLEPATLSMDVDGGARGGA